MSWLAVEKAKELHLRYPGLSGPPVDIESMAEAEVCAAHILMPGEELTKVIAMSLWDLADYFGVPEELAYHRINDYATQEEKERWDKVCYDGYV